MLIDQKIKEDETLPDLSKTSLRRVLRHLKFKFMKRSRKSTLIERQTVTKVWTDTTVNKSRQAFVEGVSTGSKNPTGKGKRLIVVHVGNENGFLDDCQWVFECSKTSDYHETIDAIHFEEWRTEKTLITQWKKQQIIDWLNSKKYAVRKKYQKYVTDEMAKEKGMTVLIFPPYHCELNPIELVWADVNGHVARNNSTYKLADVKLLLVDGFNQMTSEKWANCVEHVKKIETDRLGSSGDR
ncbi:hypothetical protein ABMA28_003466 [Loxostege sticticalis]|uniref:Transposase n=1 Tax=Loxostege sticticalis TaxID=481309 RepID=A0ABD0SW83_LOXSC